MLFILIELCNQEAGLLKVNVYCRNEHATSFAFYIVTLYKLFMGDIKTSALFLLSKHDHTHSHVPETQNKQL